MLAAKVMRHHKYKRLSECLGLV